MNKVTPMLDPKKKKEQKIDNQDPSEGSDSNSDTSKKPTKKDPDKVPESNDPAGYSDSDTIKKSPFEKK